jgi:hypothetical protein
VKIPNKKHVYAALAVLAALIIIIIAIPSGKHRDRGKASIKGINAVLTNEMSDRENLAKMERDLRSFMQRWQIR